MIKIEILKVRMCYYPYIEIEKPTNLNHHSISVQRNSCKIKDVISEVEFINKNAIKKDKLIVKS